MDNVNYHNLVKSVFCVYSNVDCMIYSIRCMFELRASTPVAWCCISVITAKYNTALKSLGPQYPGSWVASPQVFWFLSVEFSIHESLRDESLVYTKCTR